MKVIYIPGKINLNRKAFEEGLKKIPHISGKIGVVTTVQYLDYLDEAIKILKESGHDVIRLGQVTGCNQETALKADCDSYIFIGTGRFHPLGITIKTGKHVLVFNPHDGRTSTLDENELKTAYGKIRKAMGTLGSATDIGIIVSTKAGQKRYADALELKRALELREKKAYIFLADTLDYNQLINFPKIECWINTMCPRMGIDDTEFIERPFMNIDDIPEEFFA